MVLTSDASPQGQRFALRSLLLVLHSADDVQNRENETRDERDYAEAAAANHIEDDTRNSEHSNNNAPGQAGLCFFV